MSEANKTEPNNPNNAKQETVIRVATRDKINVKLTTEEIRDRAMLLPSLMSEVEGAEEESKSVAKEHKKRIDSIKRQLKSMRTIVDSGEEFREVECERIFNIEKGITWLEFNGHKYLSRSATEKELELVRQGNIFDQDAEEAPPPVDPTTTVDNPKGNDFSTEF